MKVCGDFTRSAHGNKSYFCTELLFFNIAMCCSKSLLPGKLNEHCTNLTKKVIRAVLTDYCCPITTPFISASLREKYLQVFTDRGSERKWRALEGAQEMSSVICIDFSQVLFLPGWFHSSASHHWLSHKHSDLARKGQVLELANCIVYSRSFFFFFFF